MAEDNVLRIRLSLKGRPLKSYTFDKPVITCGRSDECDIVLDNSSISRIHLQFERTPKGHYTVRDLNSANGTFLNEERIKTAYLYNNDVIRLGKFSLWISLERDRRAGTEQSALPSGDQAQPTMMLSTAEINRLMNISREQDIVAPAPEPSSRGRQPVAQEKQWSRLATLIGIGIALIVATTVGAAAAWFIIK
jgi:FHA domain